mmetsp:Transcript_5703/g.12461  ORF Transcript_5703/g.12461 Transcript_5703/m.12461 type:complete len:123 (+) Transcript_5703:193-561(+)
MRTSCSFSILRRGFFVAFAFVALDTTILRDGVGSVYGFLLSDSSSSSSSIFSHHCAIVEKKKIPSSSATFVDQSLGTQRRRGSTTTASSTTGTPVKGRLSSNPSAREHSNNSSKFGHKSSSL